MEEGRHASQSNDNQASRTRARPTLFRPEPTRSHAATGGAGGFFVSVVGAGSVLLWQCFGSAWTLGSGAAVATVCVCAQALPRVDELAPRSAELGGAVLRLLPQLLRQPPIDAPCPQCLRHGEPMHAQERLTGTRPAGAPAPRSMPHGAGAEPGARPPPGARAAGISTPSSERSSINREQAWHAVVPSRNRPNACVKDPEREEGTRRKKEGGARRKKK
eukprot:COSAG01_NODE_177_length_22954_cov_28.699554_21_plen_218_part_00